MGLTARAWSSASPLVHEVYDRTPLVRLHLAWCGIRLALNGGRVRNRAGVTLFVDRGDERGRRLAARRGRCDKDAVGLWNALCDAYRPDVVVDVGANYGEVVLSRSYGASTAVHLVEPSPAVLPFLLRSAARFPHRVLVHQVAASDQAVVAPFRIPTTSSGLASLVHDVDGADVTVECRRVDDLVVCPEGATLVFKIDVEGHERAALDGMRRLLDAAHEWIGFCEGMHLRPADAAALLEDFDVYIVEPETWRLTPVLDAADVVRPPLGHMKDVVLCRRGAPPRIGLRLP